MPRVVILVVAILVMAITALSGPTPPVSVAQGGAEATPVGGPAAVCTPAQEEMVSFVPPYVDEAVVKADWMDGRRLYAAVVTVPSGACIEYRPRNGAVILYVYDGEITYGVQIANKDILEIVTGNSDSVEHDVTPVTLTLATTPPANMTETLSAGEWVTQDRTAWFTFRNDGSDDAVIFASVLASRGEWDNAPCTGGCRDRP